MTPGSRPSDRRPAGRGDRCREPHGRCLVGALTHAPFFGDDAHGLRVLASTLALVSTDGVAPMAESVDELDRLNAGDRIDLDARGVTSGADEPGQPSLLGSRQPTSIRLTPRGSLGFFDQRYEDYAEQLDSAASSLASADTAAQVLPDMIGADGERDYLLLFQNNAEIRATGGMPGSWAHIHAEDGRLEMVEQGTASDFPTADEPVVPLTDAELAVYGKEYGLFFQDPGFAPDFQRGAEIWEAHWERQFPEIELDGVLALDPVGMSYLLEGTGPVTVRGTDAHQRQCGRRVAQSALPRTRPRAAGRILRGSPHGPSSRRPPDAGLARRLRRGSQPSRARGPLPGRAVRRRRTRRG